MGNWRIWLFGTFRHNHRCAGPALAQPVAPSERHMASRVHRSPSRHGRRYRACAHVEVIRPGRHRSSLRRSPARALVVPCAAAPSLALDGGATADKVCSGAPYFKLTHYPLRQGLNSGPTATILEPASVQRKGGRTLAYESGGGCQRSRRSHARNHRDAEKTARREFWSMEGWSAVTSNLAVDRLYGIGCSKRHRCGRS